MAQARGSRVRGQRRFNNALIRPLRAPIVTRLMLGLAAGLCISCTKTTAKPNVLPAHAVQYAGCDAVVTGPVCLLSASNRSLVLWWPQRFGQLTALRGSQGALPLAQAQIQHEGYTLRLEAPALASWVELVLGDGSHTSQYRLALGTYAPLPALEEAARRQKGGDVSGALVGLQEAALHAQGIEKPRLLAAIARLKLQTQDVPGAIKALRVSMAAAQREGLLSQALKDAVALSYALLNYRQDYAGARAVIEAALPLTQTVPEHRLALRYNEGGIASQVGNIGEALAAFRDSAHSAQKLGRDALARTAQRHVAVALRLIGRSDEAVALQRALVQGPWETPCDASDDRLNLALSLLALVRGQGALAGGLAHTEEPLRLMQHAQEDLANCPDPFRQRNLLIEQLLLAVEQGALEAGMAAQKALLMVQGGQSPLLQVWQHDAQGRLALLRGQWQIALRFFENENHLAQHLGLAQESFRALVGQGMALKMGKRRGLAVAALQQAEAALDGLARQVPLGQGVAAFTRDHRQSVQELVQTLLQMGQQAAAADAVRVARSRALLLASQAPQVARLSAPARQQWETALAHYHQLRSQFELQQANWDRPVDKLVEPSSNATPDTASVPADIDQALDEVYRALRPGASVTRATLRKPGEDEIVLGYFQANDGLLGFVVTPKGARFARVDDVPAESNAARMSSALLTPFERELTNAKLISLVLPPAMWPIDFASLPWKSKPLAQHAAIQYQLDVCHGVEGCVPQGVLTGRASALVISDPKLDLQGARKEAASVTSLLSSTNHVIVALAGSDATHERVIDTLAKSVLLHYAGHGTFSGTDGWQSALFLGQDTRLLVGDILSLKQAPRKVVLSSCEGARLDETAGGLSLAHAFVTAGAGVVIAAVRQVPDATARALSEALYEGGFADPHKHPAAVLRKAQLDLHARSAIADAWTFRAVVP